MSLQEMKVFNDYAMPKPIVRITSKGFFAQIKRAGHICIVSEVLKVNEIDFSGEISFGDTYGECDFSGLQEAINKCEPTKS